MRSCPPRYSSRSTLFHTTHGYYAEGVEAGTAVLPEGWEGRVLTREIPGVESGSVTAHFPDLHDLCVSKLVVDRTVVLARAITQAERPSSASD